VVQIPGQTSITARDSLKWAILHTQPLCICPFADKRSTEVDKVFISGSCDSLDKILRTNGQDHIGNLHEMPVNYPETSRRIYINCLSNETAPCMSHATSNPRIHEGRNLKRFREMLAIKQDVLAFELGEEWNQQKVFLLEQKEKIDSDILEQVAAILKIPAEAIRNFDEEKAMNIISNTFQSGSFVANSVETYHNNPIDKLIQLHEEKIALYERMLKEKDEMMLRLERLIEKR